MLTLRIRVIIIIGLVLAFILISRIIIKKKLDVKYALPWYFMLAALTILDGFPVLLTIINRIFGISSPVNMMFFFGFCFSLVIIFNLTARMYNISKRLRKVAQELALLRKEMEDKSE